MQNQRRKRRARKQVAAEIQPDICQMCHGEHGKPRFALRIELFHLEDLPLSNFYVLLCPHCISEPILLRLQQSETARSIGLIVYHLSVQPVDLGDILKRPDPGKLAEAIRLLEHADGVLIHCKNGWDRTGLLVGMYRVIYDGWTTDKAYEEMRRLGFHPELRGLREAWEAFAAAHNAGASQ
jgi:hypothetical protein